MKNVFEVNDTDKELLENIQEAISVQTNQEFLGNIPTELQRSKWDDEIECSEEDHKEEYKDLEEIMLYDPCKSLDENFESDFQKKYILIEVTKKGHLVQEDMIPDKFSKLVVDMNKMEQYGVPEFMPVDFNSIFGLRLTSFIQYNSGFFSCDERVIFEAMLIKFKYFKYQPFYWSKNEMFKEVGIKKDRATKIIKRFENIGIITSELVKSVINNRPMQITYYNIVSDRVIELLPLIFEGRNDDCNMELEITKYLAPSVTENITRKMQ